VSGTVVVAVNLADTKVGQSFSDTWRFVPRCRKGACSTILERAFTKTRFLLRRAGSRYSGVERYEGAFFCNGRRYVRGASNVGRWSISVTRSRSRRGATVATSIKGSGSIVGRSHVELPCPQVTSREGFTFSGARIVR
jgi:hypothetical protein